MGVTEHGSICVREEVFALTSVNAETRFFRLQGPVSGVLIGSKQEELQGEAGETAHVSHTPVWQWLFRVLVRVCVCVTVLAVHRNVWP